MVVIRTGLSESASFELAYNIFGGRRVPVFFAVWDQAPIKTTLLRDLDELIPARYVTFSRPEELKEPLIDFIGEVMQNSIRDIDQTHSGVWSVIGMAK